MNFDGYYQGSMNNLYSPASLTYDCPSGCCKNPIYGKCVPFGTCICYGGEIIQCLGRWVRTGRPCSTISDKYCCVYWDGRGYFHRCYSYGCPSTGPNNSVIWDAFKVGDCTECR